MRPLYSIFVGLAILSALGLAWWWFPPELFMKAFLTALLPLLLLILAWMWLRRRRRENEEAQLQRLLGMIERTEEVPLLTTESGSASPPPRIFSAAVSETIDRLRKSFHANQQFTQNASHELQTPLAIIKGHVELLLQSPMIGEQEMESLAIVMQNTNRLSKINSALILLSKIDHQRFVDTKRLDLTKVVEEVLNHFYDLIQLQGLRIDKNYQAPFYVTMSRTLAEIMVANLVQNAIRHNVKEGYISFTIQSDVLRISNPGKDLSTDPQKLFYRFEKESDSEQSLGLGLSIIQRICEQSRLEVHYAHRDKKHILTLSRSLEQS